MRDMSGVCGRSVWRAWDAWGAESVRADVLEERRDKRLVVQAERDEVLPYPRVYPSAHPSVRTGHVRACVRACAQSSSSFCVCTNSMASLTFASFSMIRCRACHQCAMRACMVVRSRGLGVYACTCVCVCVFVSVSGRMRAFVYVALPAWHCPFGPG